MATNSSYIKLYQDFISKKSLPDKSDEMEQVKEATSKKPMAIILPSKERKMKAESKEKGENDIQMEHSYSRDTRPIEGANGLSPAKTLMIHKAPQCPSCHNDHGSSCRDENEMDEASHPPIPSYNETAAKDDMNDSLRVARSVKNINSDDDDWEDKLFQNPWMTDQRKILEKVIQILNSDQLARLAMCGKQREAIYRRLTIDKSARRFRDVLGSVNWEVRSTQWLHGILMDYLPAVYMAAYLDILQTLKAKVPSLIDKMVFGKPNVTYSKEVLGPVLKDKWEPQIVIKNRPLPENAIFVVIPSYPTTGVIPDRTQRWYKLFSTCTQIVQINMAVGGNTLNKQTLDQVAEQIVSLTRLKIKDLKNENPNRRIILIGFNSGAALALQVAFSENISSVVCMGFAYNTLNGVRGSPEDHLLDLRVPVLFVIGQNSARSSQEEMESLREKMHSETSLLVVGSADDVLRVPKSKRKIEGVTQAMVDSMIMDEIFEFVKKCILNPPGARQPLTTPGTPLAHIAISQQVKKSVSTLSSGNLLIRKRKASQSGSGGGIAGNISGVGSSSTLDGSTEGQTKAKYIKNHGQFGTAMGRPRTRPIIQSVQTIIPPQKSQVQQSSDDLRLAMQSIMGDNTDELVDSAISEAKKLTTYEIVPQSKIQKSPMGLQNKALFKAGTTTISTPHGTKIKMIPANQFVQLKPPIQSQSKIYTIKQTQPQVPQHSSNTSSGQFVVSPQKFTILKPGTSIIRSLPESTEITSTSKTASTDISSIIDMPILFADNDGNIQDAVISNPPIPPISATKSNQYVIYTPNTPQVNALSSDVNKPKKVVFINRSTMKPCPNIISKSTVPPLHKYSKVVVTNPKSSASTLVQRAQGQPNISADISALSNTEKPIVSPVRQINLQPSGIMNVQQKPIIINVNADKSQQPTQSHSGFVKLGDPNKKSIVLKSGNGTCGLKQISAGNLKPTFINRNLTVRKIVDYQQIQPTSQNKSPITTNAASLQSTANLLATLTGSSSPKTSEPKIFTLSAPNKTISDEK